MSEDSRIDSDQVITVQHLIKRYGEFVAVNDVSFSIREKEIFGIIGPNGVGKTTTVECISGLRVPDSGSIRIYGLSPQKDRNKTRRFVGVQVQESALPPRLKVGGKLALREPTGLVMGIVVPIGLLVVFGLIGQANPGNVADTGYTVLDLYVPVIMVIGFIFLGITSLPVTLVKYREMGWLRRVSTTPESPSRLLAAQLIVNLVLALATILIVIFGSELVFGVPLDVGIPYFVLSIVLSIAVIFSLGLVVAALAPSQTVASGLTGLLTFGLLFLSGLWVQPAQVGGPMATIMYYSPSGAAAEALLYSVFNTTPPLTAILTIVVYALVFSFTAIRYFRWE